MNFPIPVNLTVEELNQEQNLEFDSTIVVVPKLPEYIRYEDDITDVVVTRTMPAQGRPPAFVIGKTAEEMRALITSQTRIRFISKIQTRYGVEDSPTVYDIVRFNPDAQQDEEFLALHTVDGNKGITLSFQATEINLVGTATEDEYYELPENGVPLSDLDPNVQDVINGAVRFDVKQNLTEEEQAFARTNIQAQEALEFDDLPIEDSPNPVTSSGLYNTFEELYNTLQDDYVRYNDDVIDVTINRQILPMPGTHVNYVIRYTGDGIKALLNSQAKVRFNTSYNNDIYTLVSFNPDAQEEEVVLTLHKIDGNLETTLNFEIQGKELRATAVIDQFYELPDGGIPKETLDEGVRTSLEKADNSVQYVRQHLTTEQKAMARENIGALGTDRDVIRYIDDVVVVNITGGQAPLYRYYLSCTDVQLKGYMNSQTKVRFEYADCPCVVKYYDRNASSVYSNTLVVLECEVNNKIYTFTFAYINGSLVGTLEVGAYYTLPSEGIPKSDLSSAVQSSLDLANNAVLFNAQTLTSAEQAQARTNIGAAAVSDVGIVFKLKGEVQYVSDLPATGNRVGDVYFVSSEKVGYVWLETEEYLTGYWEQLGEPIDLSAYATLASPAFTGIPTAPTPSSGTNTSQLATAAFVQDAVTGLYTKPTDGIPLEDLTYDVQASINAIDDKIGYEDLYADRIFNVSGSKVQNLWAVDDIMEELNSGKIVRFFEYTEASPSGVQLNRYQIMDTTLDSKIKIACILDDCVRFVDFVPVLDGDEYVYDGTVSVQSIGGTAMSAYDSTPLMDGVGSAGVLDTYARGDHVHPVDQTLLHTTDSVVNLYLTTPSTVEEGVTVTLNRPAQEVYDICTSQQNTFFILSTSGAGIIFIPIKIVGSAIHLFSIESSTTNQLYTLILSPTLNNTMSGILHVDLISTAEPSNAIPQMDGTGNAGDSVYYARADHRHPSDTTKLSTTGNAYRALSIPMGTVDSTSTATEFTATIDGITELRDGVCVWLTNGVIKSAAGCTLDINGLGAKPIYISTSAATAVSTTFAVAYTMLFIYNSTRVEGGCWDMVYGYNTDTNTIGYQLRTNSTKLPMAQKVYRYRLLFTSADGTKWVGANTSTSTNATAARTPNQTKIDPFGKIVYYGYTSAIAADDMPGSSYMWTQYVVTLGYSFNNTGATLELTPNKPLYLKCAPQSDGSAIIDGTTPYTLELPSTEDGKIYIFLGITIDGTTFELVNEHPVYCYRNGGIQKWTGVQREIDGITIPSTLSSFTNDVGFITSSQIPAVPSAASTLPEALGSAAVGSSADYARADHVHAMPSAIDVGALSSTTTYVASINGSSGSVQLSIPSTAADVGAFAIPSTPPSVDAVWMYSTLNSAWGANTLAIWSGGSY